MTKYIFVTGGVCSGLGKGIATASIGAILKSAGFKVSLLKIDPYLNVDPGGMTLQQHGEIFVTEDGYEGDMDLGHYERFIDENLTNFSNLTTGQVYERIIERERNGDFAGRTIQIIPHITGYVKEFIEEASRRTDADFLITEIGGTVGDMEGEPYLEAARQFHREKGDENVLFVHLTLLPYLKTSKELKTKPTQASIRELHRRGIHPDIILARADRKIPSSLLEKIALFCDIPLENVIPAPTIKNIYQVPLNFEKANISKIIFKKFGLRGRKPNLKKWENLNKKIKNNKKFLKVALVGKYTQHVDVYLSLNEAIKSASWFFGYQPLITPIDSEKLEKNLKEEWKKLKVCEGIIVPGGFIPKGLEGEILACRYARKNKIPFLGISSGIQAVIIEFGRSIGLKEAEGMKFDLKKIDKKGGNMCLGAYKAILLKNTKVYQIYGRSEIFERHRYCYEFNNVYKQIFEKNGLKISGINPELNLVEFVELENHPFFIATQFHPEFKSRPLRPHPLFKAFIKAVIKR